MRGRAILKRLRWGALISLFLGGALVFPAGASAEVTIHGGKDDYRDRIRSLLEEHWSQEQLENTHLAITVGSAGLVEYCGLEEQKPVLAVYLYESRFTGVSDQCQQPVAPIFVDAPLPYLGRLAGALFPGSHTAMLVSGDPNGGPQAEKQTHILLPIPGEGVAKGLGRLIEEGRWDVFLLPIDSSVYQATDYRLTLETLFRHRKPAIVSIRSLLSQGAVAAAYYTPTQIEEAVIRSINQLIERGELVGGRPDSVRVGINKTVLRNLYGRVITAEELRALEAEVNGG